MIWSLGIDTDTLFSGDSKGSLKVWDIKIGYLMKEFNEHNGDILSICTYNKTVYFTGSDSQIITLQNNGQWIMTSKFRGQSHDINSLCIMNEDHILSGGLTTDICIYKLNNGRFIEKYDRKVTTNLKRHISAFEQRTKISVFHNDYTILLHRGLDKVSLWSISNNNVNFLAEINKKSESHIISSAITDGYISYSDNTNTIIFKYNLELNEIKKIKKLNFSSKFLFFRSCNLVSLNQDNNNICIYDLQSETIDNIQINGKEIYISGTLYKDYLVFSTISKKLILIDLKNKSIEYNLPSFESYITQMRFLNNNTLISVVDDNRYI
jgi:hypothetical protein